MISCRGGGFKYAAIKLWEVAVRSAVRDRRYSKSRHRELCEGRKVQRLVTPVLFHQAPAARLLAGLVPFPLPAIEPLGIEEIVPRKKCEDDAARLMANGVILEGVEFLLRTERGGPVVLHFPSHDFLETRRPRFLHRRCHGIGE